MTYDSDLLNAALIGLESRRREIDERIAEVQARLKGHPGVTTITRRMIGGVEITNHSTSQVKQRKRKMSAEGRAKIAAAAKKRWKEWAKAKSAKSKPVAKAVKRKPAKKKAEAKPEAEQQVA